MNIVRTFKTKLSNRSTFAIFVIILTSLQSALASTITWTGNGGNNSWHTPGNWDLNRQPVDGDDVVIPDVAGAPIIQYSTGTVNLNSLTSHERIQLSGGTLNLGSTSQINGTMTHSGGTLGGSGTLNVSGLYDWTGGTMAGNGITNANGGLTIGGTSELRITDRTLNNAGTANWTGTGNIVSIGGTFNNLGGATFNDRTNADWLGSGTFNNHGTYVSFGTADFTDFGVAFNNHNLVSLETGSIRTLGGGSSTGTFLVDSGHGSMVEFGGGTYTFNDGTSLQTNSPSTNEFRLTGGTLNVSSDTNAANFTQIGGILTGSGTLHINGSLIWEAGTMRGIGATNANGESEFSSNGAKQLFDLRYINIRSTCEWTGGNISSTVQNRLNILEGGVLRVATDSDILGTGTVDNDGTIEKLGSSGETQINGVFNQNGQLDIQSGMITLTGSGASDGDFHIAPGAVLNFSNTNYTFNEGTEIEGEGTARLSSGTLTINGGASVDNFELIAGTLTGSAPLRIQMGFNWTGGFMRGSGITYLDGVTNVSGSVAKQILDTRVIHNAGIFNWTGTGNFNNGTSTSFNNLSTGVFNIQTDADWLNGPFNNAGIVTKSVTTGETQFTGIFNNTDSQMNVQTGILNLRNSGTDTGAYTVFLPAIIKFSNGTRDFNAGADFDGAGTVEFAGGTQQMNVDPSLEALALITAGNVFFNTTATLNTLTLSGGTLGGSGVVNISGAFNWSGGTMQDNGVTNANGGMSISGNNPKFFLNNRTLNNAGLATWTGVGSISGPSTTTFHNLHGAILDIQTDGDMFSVTVVNDGTIRKSVHPGDTQISGMFTNNHLVDVQAGILSLSGNFTNFANNVLTGGIYRVASHFRFTNADIVTNAAEVELTGPNSRITDYLFNPNDAFRNFTLNTQSATFHVRDGRDFTPTVPLTNAGSMIIGQNSTFSFSQDDQYTKTATGSLTLRNGTFAPSNFYIQTAGLTQGIGAIHVFTLRTTDEANLSPGESAGEITINGDYIHDGRLIIELGDPDTGDFDVLNITGHATLNGTLTIQEMPDYTPQVGDSYTVLTYGSRAGSFHIIEGRHLSNGLLVRSRFFDDHLQLTVFAAGDVNGNGCVDDADLLAVLFAFGTSDPDADLNGDGIVDDADLLDVLFHFGAGC